MRGYSHLDVLFNNLPYVAMVLLGSAIFVLGFDASPWAWPAAVAYLASGVAGAVWVMVFICPSCAYYATRSCPCGYGVISARLVRRGRRECFSEKFRRHIPVIVPVWLIPVAAGAVALVRHGFSWPLAGLVAAFSIDAFVVLPLVSRRHGCAGCPQKESCPWMGLGKVESVSCGKGSAPAGGLDLASSADRAAPGLAGGAGRAFSAHKTPPLAS